MYLQSNQKKKKKQVSSSRIAKDTSIKHILDILFKYHLKKYDTAIFNFVGC